MNRISQYFGPDSPLGPLVAGLLSGLLLVLIMALVGPPIFWVVGKWWSVWL